MRVVLTLLLLSSIPCSATPAVFISGQVLQQGSRIGVSGAAISLFPAAGPGLPSEQPAAVAQALGNGAYVLRLPAAGKYRLSVSAPNYMPHESIVDIPTRGLTGYALLLEKFATLTLKLQPPA